MMPLTARGVTVLVRDCTHLGVASRIITLALAARVTGKRFQKIIFALIADAADLSPRGGKMELARSFRLPSPRKLIFLY
jgi:hypothetical protein